MSRAVVISGLGPVSAVGVGVAPFWQAAQAGASGIGPLTAFDPAGFASRLAGQVKDLKVSDHVPKSYRKAVKVMARDIELAVAAADLAARDAGLVTRGTANGDAAPHYPPGRVGAHIGAALIAAEVNELTSALAEARVAPSGDSPAGRPSGGATGGGGESAGPSGSPSGGGSGGGPGSGSGSGPGGGAPGRDFDIHRWGKEGLGHLTPLWLLKYLPNMLACHVTIIHDAQGPSNTITCTEASSGLSIGESLRVIQRGAAEACFCGGAESRLNLLGMYRQGLLERLNPGDQAAPAQAVRPFCRTAAGTVVGEGGAIVVIEAQEAFQARVAALGPAGPRPYARIAGFGASQTVNPATRNLAPDAQGRSIAGAMRAALRDAGLGPDDIDLVVPLGLGAPAWDQAEAAALRSVFGRRLAQVPVVSLKPLVGNCGAGAGALDVCLAALALKHQALPARVNCAQPLEGLAGAATAAATPAKLRHALTISAGFGGQNAALVLSAC